MLRFVVVIGVVLSLVSCLNGGGSGKSQRTYKALDSQQKQRLQGLTEAFGDLNLLAGNYLPAKKQSKNNLKTNSHLLNVFVPMATKEASSEASSKSKKMSEIIDENDCEMKLPIDELEELSAGTDMSLPVFVIEIKGEACPIQMRVEVTGQQTPNGFDAIFNWSYLAKSDEFKQLGDIDMVDMKGKINARVDQSQQGQSIQMVMDFNGIGHSQTEGDFVSTFGGNFAYKITIPPQSSNGSMPGDFDIAIDGNFDQKFGLDFADVESLLEEKIKMTGLFDVQATHYMNQQQITHEEYQEYMKNISFPGVELGDGMGGSQPDQGHNGQDPIGQNYGRCTLSVYDSNQISKPEIDEAISRNRRILVNTLAFFDSCGPVTQTAMVKGRELRADFMFFPDFMQLNMYYPNDIGSAWKSLYANPDENLNMADSYQDVSLHFQCQSQVRCGN